MANKPRKMHSPQFKYKVAQAAINGNKPVAELCQEFGVAASQIHAWKKHFEEHAPQVFADKRRSENHEETVEKLHAIIGKLKVENDFFAKALNH